MTAYLTTIFLCLFSAAQFADHIAAKACQERTDYVLSYDHCRQMTP
jgi:hypothetical protein